jgi:hypothetical protein
MRHRVNFREPLQRFLIVCEGEATEPLYFRDFRVPGDVKTVKVEGLGKNTLSLVNEAIRLKGGGDYDQVWCVFDIEDYSPDQVNAALRLAAQNDIQVAYSNQAFEIWYLLHFHYYNTPVDRKEYASKLSKHLGFEYRHNLPGLYIQLLQHQPQAMKRAERLFDQYNPHNPGKDDPSTTVHTLVKELNRFTPDSRK